MGCVLHGLVIIVFGDKKLVSVGVLGQSVFIMFLLDWVMMGLDIFGIGCHIVLQLSGIKYTLGGGVGQF